VVSSTLVVLLTGLLLACEAAPPHLAGQGPVVRSVEPPNWWVGHSLDPVQILVGGSGLTGTTLASATPGVSILAQKVNPAGTYLIAYARIAPTAKVGRVSLRIDGPSGGGPVPFDLVEPLDPANRFRGLTPADTVYLVMPDRFANGDATNDVPRGSYLPPDRSRPFAYHGGDLAGLTKRLEYIRDLGFSAIWLTPYYDNDDDGSAYHGYHATDFYAVEERFGTMADVRAFVDRAHALGLKVVQDQVANHTGERHRWLQDAPTPTWLNGTASDHLDNSFDIPSVVDPKADPGVRKATLEGWFGNHLPDINQNDPDAAAYLIQNSLWWVEMTGIDAIRQDTMPYAPRAYWSAWMKALKARRPSITVIGEVFHGDPKIVSVFQGGATHDGVDTLVDSVFDFPLYYPLVEFFSAKRPATRIAELLAADSLYPNPGVLSPFVGNHDTPRQLGLLHGDARAQRLLQTCLFTMRGIPTLFYGDEIGMPGGQDPDNRRDFPGGFAGDERDAFLEAGRTANEEATLRNLRRVIQLRKKHPALRGRTTRVLVAEPRLFAYSRESEGERAIVAINNADVPMQVDVDASGLFPPSSVLVDALSGRPVTLTASRLRTRLPARTAAIYFVR
jgi:neopullulanase